MFGHNFYKSKNINASSDELTCKSCQYKTTSSIENDVSELSQSCKEVPSLLIQLNNLKRVLTVKTVSFWS